MEEKYTNGSKVLTDEIETELLKRSITHRDRLMLRSMKYLLEEVPTTRTKIGELKTATETLEKNSVLLQAKKHPKAAFLTAIGLLVVNSMVNWAGIRKPIVQAIILQTTGILLPLDAIP